MPRRIAEKELILPALFFINGQPEITTTQLSTNLRELLKPQGEDLEILSDRNDDKFSQKVRNLKSHGTLESQGLAIYDQGYWTITQKGREYLENNQPLLTYLIEQGFNYHFQQEALNQVPEPQLGRAEELNLFDEAITDKDIIILEGRSRIVKQKIYDRSQQLRALAISHYTVEGQISCHVCQFNFGKVYGVHGQGFIEIHHTKPIFSYGDEDLSKTLEEALKNVVPLCSNCHRMIHRKHNQMLSIEELKAIISSSQ